MTFVLLMLWLCSHGWHFCQSVKQGKDPLPPPPAWALTSLSTSKFCSLRGWAQSLNDWGRGSKRNWGLSIERSVVAKPESYPLISSLYFCFLSNVIYLPSVYQSGLSQKTSLIHFSGFSLTLPDSFPDSFLHLFAVNSQFKSWVAVFYYM